MAFKDFYIKYRKPLFISTTVLSSIIIAFALDRYILRNKAKIKVKKQLKKNE